MSPEKALTNATGCAFSQKAKMMNRRQARLSRRDPPVRNQRWTVQHRMKSFNPQCATVCLCELIFHQCCSIALMQARRLFVLAVVKCHDLATAYRTGDSS